MELLKSIIVINTFFIIVYLIKSRHNKHIIVFAFMFYILPLFGLALYYLPHILYSKKNHKNLYDRNEIISGTVSDNFIQKPKVEEEMNIIPFEEAIAVSDVGEKRGLLLGLLKGNMVDNYKVTLSALEDSDSETSHYAAAATMEIIRKIRNSIQEIEELYYANKSNTDILRQYIDELYRYIDSGVLSSRDRMLQVGKYSKLMKYMIEEHPELLQQNDYVHQIELLLEQNQYYEAVELAKHRLSTEQDEGLYMKLLEIYFNMKNREEFHNTLDQLRNSKVVLSSKGIDVLRFWIARG